MSNPISSNVAWPVILRSTLLIWYSHIQLAGHLQTRVVFGVNNAHLGSYFRALAKTVTSIGNFTAPVDRTQNSSTGAVKLLDQDTK